MNASETPRRSWLLRRLGAWLYDGLLILALWFAAGALVLALRGGEAPPVNTSWYTVLLLAVLWGFFIGFWRRGGQTLGMRAWNLKLVSESDGRPGFNDCIARLTVATLTAGLGVLWSLVPPAHRSLQGLASGTRVVYADRRADASTEPATRRSA